MRSRDKLLNQHPQLHKDFSRQFQPVLQQVGVRVLVFLLILSLRNRGRGVEVTALQTVTGKCQGLCGRQVRPRAVMRLISIPYSEPTLPHLLPQLRLAPLLLLLLVQGR